MQPVASKVIASSLGAAVATVAIWAAEFAIDIPETVEAALVVIFTFALGWLVPETRYQR